MPVRRLFTIYIFSSEEDSDDDDVPLVKLGPEGRKPRRALISSDDEEEEGEGRFATFSGGAEDSSVSESAAGKALWSVSALS